MLQLLFILTALVTGYFLKVKIINLEFIINSILLIILFIIAFQLRYQNISVNTVLLNKLGIKIALLIVFSSLIAGVASAEILGLWLKIGLVLSSGLGWCTLSGVLAGQLMEFTTCRSGIGPKACGPLYLYRLAKNDIQDILR